MSERARRCAIALAAAITVLSPFAATAEVDVREPKTPVVLVPASAEPVWDWLRDGTRANDPFFHHPDLYDHDRAAARVVTRREAFPGGWNAPVPATDFGFTVGKDDWHVQADPRHHLVFYREGCCSYKREVLTRIDATPPAGVASGDLRRMVPASGVRIGDAADVVYRKLGRPARLLRSPLTRRWAAAYVRPLSIQGGASCIEQGTAVFEGERLVAYELWRGC